jgi:hypothetical protein
VTPFFEVPEPPKKRPKRRRLRRADDDPWSRPRRMLPGYLGTDFVLAQSDEAAVIVHGIACYPTGFAFQLETVMRYEREDDEDFALGDAFHAWHHIPRSAEVSPKLLRFGIAFSDGAKVTTLDADRWERRDERPDEVRPHLELGGGGGGDGEWSYEIWIWPLPPEGPVTFACEWPAFGIEETTRRVEGRRFVRAAGRAKAVFRASS